MRVYPSVLLQVGDLVESPNGRKHMRYVTDIVEGVPLLCDGTHVFSPRWGFYFKKEYGAFVPVVDNCATQENNVSYFHLEHETNWGFEEKILPLIKNNS